MSESKRRKRGSDTAWERLVALRRPAQIRAVVSPVRQEIVDTLQVLGTCSVSDVAAELGRPADGLYYHFRVLVRAGVVERRGEREVGGRRETVYSLPGSGAGLRLHYDPGDARNAEWVTRVVGSMLRVTARDFNAAYVPDLAVCDGPRRNLWAARLKAWLSESEVEEVNELLHRLRRLLERPRRRGDRRLHAFTFVLTPVESSSVRRE